MENTLIVGVMGGGHVDPQDATSAYRLGSLIAEQGWILLNGGRNAGVMASSARGARENGGITVGILPELTRNALHFAGFGLLCALIFPMLRPKSSALGTLLPAKAEATDACSPRLSDRPSRPLSP